MIRISVASCESFISVKAPSRKFLVYLECKLPSATFPLQRAPCFEKSNTHFGGGVIMGQNGKKLNKIRSYFYICKHRCEGGYFS
jgi:hypothetical protein